MGSRDAKQFVYRYNGVESSEEVEVDYDGEVSVPMQNQIVTRKGKAWKAIAIMTQISTEVFSNPKMSLKEARVGEAGFVLSEMKLMLAAGAEGMWKSLCMISILRYIL
jgi:hypothetical protein